MRTDLSPHDPGLLTRSQFLDLRNPRNKYHPDTAYNYTLLSLWLNKTVKFHGTADGWRSGRPEGIWMVEGNSNGELIYYRRYSDDPFRLVAVIHTKTMYFDALFDPDAIPTAVVQNKESYPLTRTAQIPVKYPLEYKSLVDDVGSSNRSKYPIVLQNIVVQGEPFQIRAKQHPQYNEGDTIIVLRSDGYAVALAVDEWGATLITVVSEYRGRGIGQILADLWYRFNPKYESGGFTRSGRDNAVKTWAARVREFLANGWYSDLVRNGILSKEQVDAILADLPPRPTKKTAKAIEESENSRILVYLDDPKDPIGFVIYDSRFIEDNDEKYILAHGFFRDSENIGIFLFTIDYERPFAKLATTIALQIARDAGEPIYVGKGYGDVVEWQLIDNVVKDGDYISMTSDALDLQALARIERAFREPNDPYDGVKHSLLEIADIKWRN